MRNNSKINIQLNYSKDGVLKIILPYIKGKDVLDVGCVEHDVNGKNKERIWVHDLKESDGG